MTVQEAISARHSVRTYLTKPVEPAIVNALRAEIRACNAEGGLHIQLVMNEPMAFRGFFAHYGKFRGVCNYIVLAGKRAKDLDERAGCSRTPCAARADAGAQYLLGGSDLFKSGRAQELCARTG